MTTTTTSESSSTDTPSVSGADITDTIKSQQHHTENQKPPSKASSLSSYLGRLFTMAKPKKVSLDIQKSRPVNNTMGKARPKWWRLGFRRKKMGNKKNGRFVWCFRPVAETSNLVSQKQSLIWTTFEKRNQRELTEQFERFSHGAVHESCKLQDNKIFGGKLVVTVMLKEGMAFVLDPEWSEPITYEITWLPKLSWYQRMRALHGYKRYIKNLKKQQRQEQDHL